MTSSLYVTALDLGKYADIQGSGNDRVLQAILTERSEYIARHDAYFRSWLKSDGFLSLQSAMEQIVMGTIDPEMAPKFQFEHAAALLADSLGERLDATFFEETRPALWDEVDSVITARQANGWRTSSSWPELAEVLDRGPLLSVPLDSSAPLGTGYLTKLEVARAWEAAEHVDLETRDGLPELEWPEEALEGTRVYRQWLQQATTSGLGLFLHC